MANTKELILVYNNMNSVSLKQSVDIMLTPYFYTLKKEALAIKYHYQAKRIASSLFNGLLDKADDYDYFLTKAKDGEWIFIAYSPNMIKSFLEQKGFDLNRVSKIYFIDQSVEMLNAPLLLGDKEALVNLNSTAVIVPQIALGENERVMKVDKTFTPKKGISLGDTESVVSFSQTVVVATIFMFFSIIFIFEGVRYSKQGMEAKEQMELLLENYPSLQSSYTRDSIASKYRAIDKKERRKRDIVNRVSKMVSKGITLSHLLLDSNNFSVEFICENQKIFKKLKELAKEQKFKVKDSSSGNILQIEGRL